MCNVLILHHTLSVAVNNLVKLIGENIGVSIVPQILHSSTSTQFCRSITTSPVFPLLLQCKPTATRKNYACGHVFVTFCYHRDNINLL